ncbi:hypothetical protein [Actinophytocola glycyrrhizae]|uniref:Uncharacterized protein n=1 Tax=Actinophytocola glycyrrhizae TaxID=2044873 RepID=A0ABV9SC89_9PSEU
MLGVLLAAAIVAAAIKVTFAACGHRVTWRLAFVLAFLALLLTMCASVYAAR